MIRAGILELTLPGPGFYTLEINGFHNCLHIFADGHETHAYAKDAERATYRFEHGVFDAGLITLRSGESLYIGEDAVVYGSVVAEDAENVRIFGGGVLDNSRFLRDDPGCLIWCDWGRALLPRQRTVRTGAVQGASVLRPVVR